ncbi:ABC transporter ATP-binding protein [Tepidimicrobium xylanilyticum]|uniref:Carbohydrate ABC transporter ATP-binding protein, CUT1 family n=1 Tax=Tepidimicrobium xylanilyticum TaxID=1123352 RepID=A0A1H3E164_9FIRM|nr:sn-glycerol-3-phosphate ABC transporter ATP-binding protein UgpC [Tepidimicrobium xylanilyticum]SDX71654.1 carbohydrate ABC transporter ATP-binding protein, CUT1 family [Tepidimicrobium xylanilyticum]
MASITFKNIRKVYDNDVVAVKNFNLEIDEREFIVLVGPSGCGKTTLLRMVAGLEEISSGELYIGDRLVNNVAPKDRDIAMVFQNYALYPHMTVYDNMAFGLKVRKLDKKEIDERVRNAAKILGLEDLLKRKPRALSGGQRQRVAIGRAIVRNPKVFLMDEPLSNLDAKLRNEMRAELLKLHNRLQTTFIYVTHDQTEAMTLGDRIIIMNYGEVQQIGNPQEVYENPSNEFVATFIGTPKMNIFDGELIKEDNRYFLFFNQKKIELSEDINKKLIERDIKPQPIRFGIRPEHIDLTEELEDGFKISVEMSELMGHEMLIHTDIDDNPLVIKIPTRFDIKNGDRVGIAFRVDKIHLFDKETSFNLLYNGK